VARDKKAKLEAVHARIARLSARERQVFELVVRGWTNKQIGETFGTTERTIKAQRQQVMEKMEVRSIPELVTLVERYGIFGSVSESRQTA